MIQDEIRRRLAAAIEAQEFPPVLLYPESATATTPTQLFDMPILVWVPESREVKWKCPVRACSCTPQVRGFMSRQVDDIEHRTLLLFCKYQCRSTSKMFSTLSQSYMEAQSADVSLHFPYIMTHKFGISKSLMMVIQAGVTSCQGMKSALEGVLAKRHSRFFRLRSLFGEYVLQRRDKNPRLIAPVPQTIEQYIAAHRLADQNTLTRLWLSWSDVFSGLSEMIMNAAEVKKLVRIDHSRKFTRLLKQCSSGGRKRTWPTSTCCFWCKMNVAKLWRAPSHPLRTTRKRSRSWSRRFCLG